MFRTEQTTKPTEEVWAGKICHPFNAAQPRQAASQSGQGSSRTPTTSAQVKVSNKPPTTPAKNLPPVKSKTIQEKMRLAEEERRRAIAARGKTSKFVPSVPNTSAEAFTFVSPSKVYSTPQQQTLTSQSMSSMLSHPLQTVFEDQEMSQLSQDQDMPQLQQAEFQDVVSQQVEGGQDGAQPLGTTDQPDRESEVTVNVNPSVVSESSEPPHLGGANSRTLSNVLESQIDRSESGSEAGSATTTRKRGRAEQAEQQPTRASTRDRNPPQYLNPVVTHRIEETGQVPLEIQPQANQPPSAELTAVMSAMQGNQSAVGTNQYNPTQFVNQFGQYIQGPQCYPATSSNAIPQNDPNFLYNIGMGYPINTMQMPRLQEQVVMQKKAKKSKKAKKN